MVCVGWKPPIPRENFTVQLFGDGHSRVTMRRMAMTLHWQCISTGSILIRLTKRQFSKRVVRPKVLEEAWLAGDTVELVLGRVLANPQ